jgi:hypothetical protein
MTMIVIMGALLPTSGEYVSQDISDSEVCPGISLASTNKFRARQQPRVGSIVKELVTIVGVCHNQWTSNPRNCNGARGPEAWRTIIGT